ncbi:salivaricin M family lantibiotic [Anaerosacchariphilus polymeriproducens]|nr:salivaricin M family lantibiotic [Anaerosacchariphilus polymeriproducens]
MNKKELRNPKERNDNMSVAYEIAEQDLAGKSGAGVYTAIQLTLAGKCGNYFTVSYECTTNNISCG